MKSMSELFEEETCEKACDETIDTFNWRYVAWLENKLIETETKLFKIDNILNEK